MGLPSAALALLTLLSSPDIALADAGRTLLGPANLGYRPLRRPTALEWSAAGSIVILDTGYRRVFHVSPEGDILVKFGGGDDDEGGFEEPSDVAVDAAGATYVLNRGALRLVKFDRAGDLLWTRRCREGDDALLLNRLCVASDGLLYATDAESDRIHRFDSEGTWVSSWNGTGETPGLHRSNPAIAADAYGRIALADRSGARVLLFDLSGRWLDTWRIPAGEFGQQQEIVDLAFAPNGHCSVLTGGDHPAVTVFDSSGVLRQSWQLSGVGRGGHAPRAIAMLSSSEIVVADPVHSRLLAYDPEEIRLTQIQREALYGEWRERTTAGGSARALLPMFREEETDLAGLIWEIRVESDISPTTTLEYAFMASLANAPNEQTLVGNPYAGIRMALPGNGWTLRVGTQFPVSPRGYEETRLVAWYADVEMGPAFFPGGLLVRPEVEKVWRAGPQWSFSTTSGFSLVTGRDGGALQEWLEYRGEVRHIGSWLRVRGGMAGRWAPFGLAALPQPPRVYPSFRTYRRTEQYGVLTEQQNQLYLRADVFPGWIRPGVEVRWWMEGTTREVVPLVLGGFLEANYNLP